VQDFSVEIYEWSGKSWEPYVADDVQVQFYMMSPYVLKTLSNDKKVHRFYHPIFISLQVTSLLVLMSLIICAPGFQGLYHTSFKVPDVYGVFQFKVEYNRLGYTSLLLSKQVSFLDLYDFSST
jgi:oligosaccharyltransferase complex subunit beta